MGLQRTMDFVLDGESLYPEFCNIRLVIMWFVILVLDVWFDHVLFIILVGRMEGKFSCAIRTSEQTIYQVFVSFCVFSGYR